MHDCRHSGNSSVEQGDCSQSSPELGAVDGRHWMGVGGTVASVLHLLPATVSWRADAAFRNLELGYAFSRNFCFSNSTH